MKKKKKKYQIQIVKRTTGTTTRIAYTPREHGDNIKRALASGGGRRLPLARCRAFKNK